MAAFSPEVALSSLSTLLPTLSGYPPEVREVLEICARVELRRLAAERSERETDLEPLARIQNAQRGGCKGPR